MILILIYNLNNFFYLHITSNNNLLFSIYYKNIVNITFYLFINIAPLYIYIYTLIFFSKYFGAPSSILRKLSLVIWYFFFPFLDNWKGLTRWNLYLEGGCSYMTRKCCLVPLKKKKKKKKCRLNLDKYFGR